MNQQTEFFRTVRETVTAAQAKATARIDAIEGDARKALTGLVEKGKESQKDLTALLDKKMPEYRARVEEIGKRVKDAQTRAVGFVDETSRGQAAAIAGELRRIADRLDAASKKDANTPASTEVH